MKKLLIVAVVVMLSLVATPANAGLGDYLSDLLGIEAAPAPASRLKYSDKVIEIRESVPQHMALWLLGTPTELDNPDAELSARLGWRNDDTEFGAQFDAIGIHGENHESFGMYGLMWVTDSEYVGYAGSIMSENISYGPFAGTVLAGVVAEGRYRSFSGESPLGEKDEFQFYAGLMLAF
ncbi:hypothetical protein LCGC14_0357650 [marine sediment metagenome]|uniref:Uncharacterized protein n=1 Tax=marine sediment metagenome TaxID=412755 RepID=A0A0F9T8U1_9ZZZZ